MRVPFTDIAQMRQRPLDSIIDGSLESDDSAFESLRTASAVRGLWQCMRDMDGFAADVSDAKKDTACLVGKTAFPQPGQLGQQIVAIGDRPPAERQPAH